MNFKRSIVEGLGETLISTLSSSNACNRYIAIQKLLDCTQEEYWNPVMMQFLI